MVNFHVLNNSLVLNYNGKTEVISRSDTRFQRVYEAIKEGRFDDIPALVEIEMHLEGTGLELRDGLLFDGDSALPEALNKRILAFRDEGLPYKHLLQFWDNVKKNPSFNSRQMLFAFLEHNGHPITQDGCFIAYRGVTEDFKDKHSGKFDNSPGSICEMSRDQVDDNPNNTCSHGLHVACFAYAKDFGSKLVEVKVNPTDVVAVPTDYNGTKMRVCKFEVVQECQGIRTETLYNPDKGISRNELMDDEDESCNGCGACETCDENNRNTLENGTCPDCHSDVDSDDAFCKHCGVDLDQYR